MGMQQWWHDEKFLAWNFLIRASFGKNILSASTESVVMYESELHLAVTSYKIINDAH
jgi:hypothetical protein